MARTEADDPTRATADLAREALELERAGQVLEALDLLDKIPRADRGAEMESRLIHLRRDAFDHLDRTARSDEWPPPSADPFPGERSVPEVAATELTASLVAGAVRHHGCVLVRGLAGPEHVEVLRDGLERAFAARDAYASESPVEELRPWYEPFLPELGKAQTFGDTELRTVDSPRTFNDLMEVLDATGFEALLNRFFGERPAMSMNKCALRRVPGFKKRTPDFHQDGSFLGEDIRTLNLWLALTDCGVDAPSLDVIPTRPPRVLPVGVDGAWQNWTVSKNTVAKYLGGMAVERPVFAPGDALLFDHLLVHRTGTHEDMGSVRCAIENWFFAPSVYPVPDLSRRKSRPHVPLVL